MLAPMPDLTLEIVEGPGAGRQLLVTQPLTIGRAADCDLVLEDSAASSHHARLTPAADGSATLEDLESTNGTFVNGNELVGPARVDAGDQMQIGVTVMLARSREQIEARASAVIAVPRALQTQIKPAAYVDPKLVAPEPRKGGGDVAHPTLDKYLDVRVRRRAQLAPLALFILIAFALAIYFVTR
jgi:pSer/pThr/pTyr-binding forkhead associated (FHA) protein